MTSNDIDDHQIGNSYIESPYGTMIDPRFRAGYANPYLRTSSSLTMTNPVSGQLSAGVYAAANQRYNNSNQGQQVQVKSPGNNHSLATHV